MPLAVASKAHTHPAFFPLDPFHLFFENIVAFIWDIWTTYSSSGECCHIPKEKMELFGKLVAMATATLPPSFCGTIRDPFLKRQSQYKIYEWMALLYWYIIPIGLEVGFPTEVLVNFAQLVHIIEFAMTICGRTQLEITQLQEDINKFLREFEKLYVGGKSENMQRCRLCIFQLVHVPHHILWFGSIRLGSQATVERAIGSLGKKIRSLKAPFANLTNLIFERHLIMLLRFIYPELVEVPKRRDPMFSKKPISRPDRQPGSSFLIQLEVVSQYYHESFGSSTKVSRWGKIRLPSGVLNTALVETANPGKVPPRSHRYFEAHIESALQGGKISICGEALCFMKVAGHEEILVIYHPLENIVHYKALHVQHGVWSTELKVMNVSNIHALIGIWEYNKKVYILRKHPGLEWLTPEECGAEEEEGDGETDWRE